MIRKTLIAAAAIAAAAITAGGGYAIAATTLPGQVGQLAGCINTATHTVDNAYGVPANLKACPKGQVPFVLKGGQQGPQGPQGQPGVVATGTTTLVGSSGSVTVATGGSFVANATDTGTITLAAGTYQLNLHAKATPSSATGDVQVYPVFAVYSQPASPDFTGDEFNVGSGALESGANANIDSYFSGVGQVTVPAGGETLHVYAFGYDSDRSAGSYALDSLTVTVTQLQTQP